MHKKNVFKNDMLPSKNNWIELKISVIALEIWTCQESNRML